MSFLTPLFLALGLLAIPVILMYMLRLRRREVVVSSTMLWQQLMRDREANAPWQKLRRNLLLLLQLLILLALVLALARPFIPVPSLVTSSVVVLLDGSASMQATDVEPGRFEVAKTEVTQLIADLSGDNQMTLIKVGQTPQVLASATSDKAVLRDVLATVQADNGRSDWQAAFALASGAAQGFEDAKIVIISDGGLPANLPALPAEVVYVPVGFSAENLAITALATRNTESGIQLFASVANQGVIVRQALLSLTLDGVLYDSRRLVIPAQSSANTTLELPDGTEAIEAHLTDLTDDYLSLDNQAWAVHEGGVSNRALLVTEGNLFLEQVYSVLPGITAFKTTPDSDILQEAFDFYVFDGYLPTELPTADTLIINPPAAVASDEAIPFTVTGVFTYPQTIAIRLADSPLLQYVDWGQVNIRRAKAVDAPWAQSLVDADGGSLLQIGVRGGHRIAILPFDLRDSDLPLQIAFPILMANITDWLSPGRAFDAPTGLQPGQPVTIVPAASTTAVTVQKPDGTTWSEPVGEETATLIFPETNQLGLYEVSLRDANGTRPAGSFAVNLFAPDESRIIPAQALQVGQAEIETDGKEDVGQREFWLWLIAFAFIILLAEWWVHYRGAKLPHWKMLSKRS